MPFDIAAGNLSRAVLDFCRAAGLEVFEPHALLRCRYSMGLNGDFEPAAGLDILLTDTGCLGAIIEGAVRLTCTPCPLVS